MKVVGDRSQLNGSIKVFSTIMTVLGVFTAFLPTPGGNVAFVMGGIVLLVGLTYGYLAIGAQGRTGLLLCLIIAIPFVVVGVALMMHAPNDRLFLTKIVASIFFWEGAALIIAYLLLREVKGAGFLLVSACITLLVAVIVWCAWPSSSKWALGLPIGFNLISSGLTPLVFIRSMKSTSSDREQGH